jgi:hypothetical protein
LAAYTAAVSGNNHIHLIRQIRKFQRLERIMLPRVVRKIDIRGALVDGEFAATGAKENARHRFFAAAGSVDPSL